MRYLVDTSALVRLLRRQVDARWHDLEDRGLLCVCEPALAEALKMSEAGRYAAAEREITDLYLQVPIPDTVWARAARIRRVAAAQGAHHGLSVADLVIASTAIGLKLAVLHEDGDFETMARCVPELQQRRISAALN